MNKLKQAIRIPLLILVFFSVSFGASQFLRSFYVAEYWRQAPFFDCLLVFGIGLFPSTIAVWGLNNLFRGRKFFQQIAWRKLLIILFCLSLFCGLFREANGLISNLVPSLETIDDEGAGFYIWALLISISLIFPIMVGYAMWPKKYPAFKKNGIWRCNICNNINPSNCEKCLNPDCEVPRTNEDDF